MRIGDGPGEYADGGDDQKSSNYDEFINKKSKQTMYSIRMHCYTSLSFIAIYKALVRLNREL
jgi:hypothetical protein